MQDLRSQARKSALTLAEIDQLIDAEHERVKQRATQVGKGTPRKPPRGQASEPGSGRKAPGASSGIVVIDGGAALAAKKPTEEGSAINMTYLFWGFSQKVQIAGVEGSTPHPSGCNDRCQ